MRTPLLIEAQKRGARIVYGYEMLVHQGMEAYELWTGRSAPEGIMRDAVSRTL
jgi:shikimate dehydrogenase